MAETGGESRSDSIDKALQDVWCKINPDSVPNDAEPTAKAEKIVEEGDTSLAEEQHGHVKEDKKSNESEYIFPSGRFARVPVEVIYSKKLTQYDKFVFTLICSYANKEGKCHPSLSKMTKDGDTSKPSLIKSIKKLEETGFIKRRIEFRQSFYIVYPFNDGGFDDD